MPEAKAMGDAAGEPRVAPFIQEIEAARLCAAQAHAGG